MKIEKGKLLAFIPARGGSKSIPLKNLANLNGLPLMNYSLLAAQSSNLFSSIVCSTDDQDIAENAKRLGVEVDARPGHLGGDDISTKDVVLDYLQRLDRVPELIFIVEPTSPFLRVEDIKALHKEMIKNPNACSGQTIAKPQHTHHAWNQRLLKQNLVYFAFEERKSVFRKQDKPELYTFGNLIACRSQMLLNGSDVFSEPSVGVEIEWPYDVNIDHENDLILAGALLAREGVVKLSHINKIRSI